MVARTRKFANLDLGSAAGGTAGTAEFFPSTAAKGSLLIQATANTGDTVTTWTNAAAGQAMTITIPDPGASASFVMTEGAQTINGTKTFGSAPTFPSAGITANATAVSSAELAALASATSANGTTGKAAILGTSGAVLFAGALTATGGVAAAGGFTVRPSNWHTGGIPAQVSTDGSDVTPSVSEMYYSAVFVPCNATITGVAVFFGTATNGNMKVGLFNSAGANVATSLSTDISAVTADTYFRVAFTGGTYAAKGPATYYIGIMQDDTSNRFNAHTFGDFPADKTTGETYATGFTTISSPATTFVTARGPIASLY